MEPKGPYVTDKMRRHEADDLTPYERRHPEEVFGTEEYRTRLTDADGTYWGEDWVYYHTGSDQCAHGGCDLYGYHFHRDNEVYFSGTEYKELRDIHAEARREAARSAERPTAWLQANGGVPTYRLGSGAIYTGAPGRTYEPLGVDLASGRIVGSDGAPLEPRDSEVPTLPAGATFTGVSSSGAAASVAFQLDKESTAAYIRTVYGMPPPDTNFNFRMT